MSDRKAVIKNADMSEEMQQDAVDCATQALEKYNIEKVSAIFHLNSKINSIKKNISLQIEFLLNSLWLVHHSLVCKSENFY